MVCQFSQLCDVTAVLDYCCPSAPGGKYDNVTCRDACLLFVPGVRCMSRSILSVPVAQE